MAIAVALAAADCTPMTLPSDNGDGSSSVDAAAAPPDMAAIAPDLSMGGGCPTPGCACLDAMIQAWITGMAPPTLGEVNSLSTGSPPIQDQLTPALPYKHIHLKSGGTITATSTDFTPYLRIYGGESGPTRPFLREVNAMGNSATVMLNQGQYEVLLTSPADAAACPNGAGTTGQYSFTLQ
jgi:hypothetical protein